MDILLLVSLLFPLFPHVSELNDCPASNCGDASFPIRFPFWLVPNQPENCGFPGFNVDCNSHGLKALKLPKPRDFFVRESAMSHKKSNFSNPKTASLESSLLSISQALLLLLPCTKTTPSSASQVHVMWKVAFVDFSATPPKNLVPLSIQQQMLVLGESRRLPGHNDTTCAICFSEYLTKETVRCTPECKNCFHADCVDGWLKLNSSCPGCRNNPSPSQANSTPPAHVKCLQSNM
ncbi:hypothetical protein C1H46_001019 [Malus baccata]|uniref:RING-type E3 ubiquitin transferase n=1 Tax=Malus baccata TaxID=106549 RepID=A0A540NQZ7_MALBA|nr:hypothetical protein C1H46_001019 [Malus baccata]